MRIEIKIDETCKEPHVLICVDRVTDEVNELIKKLSDACPKTIAGFRDDCISLLEQQAIIRFYAANQKVYAQTESGEYLVKPRLYELESSLGGSFVRISNSEIINLRKVLNLDMNLSGTICVRFSGNVTTYVSRRYVARIKSILGI